MKKMGKILALTLALMMILAGTAMAGSIKFAVIGPFTGPAANYGLACRYGAQVAADEINAQGAVVPGVGEAAVDFGAREDEAAVLAQRLQLVHGKSCHLNQPRNRIFICYSQYHREAGDAITAM